MKPSKTAKAIGLSVGLLGLIGLAGCSSKSAPMDPRVEALASLVSTNGTKLVKNKNENLFYFKKEILSGTTLNITYEDNKPEGPSTNDTLLIETTGPAGAGTFLDHGLNGLNQNEGDELSDYTGKQLLQGPTESTKEVYSAILGLATTVLTK